MYHAECKRFRPGRISESASANRVLVEKAVAAI